MILGAFNRRLTAQEVTMLFKLITAAKDSWACFYNNHSVNFLDFSYPVIVLHMRRN